MAHLVKIAHCRGRKALRGIIAGNDGPPLRILPHLDPRPQVIQERSREQNQPEGHQRVVPEQRIPRLTVSLIVQ